MENQNVLTAVEVARILRIAKNTVYKLVERGELRAYRVGKKFRFDRSDVDAYRAAMKKSAASGGLLSGRGHEAPQRVGEESVGEFADSDEASHAGNSFVLCGQDILLDILARRLESRVSGLRVYRSSLGSCNGLYALYQGSVQAATAHLWDGDNDVYNLPYVRYMLPGVPATVVRLARRVVGYYVPTGNPKGLRSWDDLVRDDLTMVNRELGSGIRVLLDEHLRLRGVEGERIPGYGTERSSHLSAAAAVAQGEGDFSLGNEKAALQAKGVEFVPLQEECYDLVLRSRNLREAPFQELLDIVASREFKSDLGGLGGYGLNETGLVLSR